MIIYVEIMTCMYTKHQRESNRTRVCFCVQAQCVCCPGGLEDRREVLPRVRQEAPQEGLRQTHVRTSYCDVTSVSHRTHVRKQCYMNLNYNNKPFPGGRIL